MTCQGEVNEAAAATEAEAHGEEVTDGHGRGSLEKTIYDNLHFYIHIILFPTCIYIISYVFYG